MKNYFDPNGTLVRSVGGKVIEGSNMIAGDGTYHRINAEGKILLKWDKIVPGKNIP